MIIAESPIGYADRKNQAYWDKCIKEERVLPTKLMELQCQILEQQLEQEKLKTEQLRQQGKKKDPS